MKSYAISQHEFYIDEEDVQNLATQLTKDMFASDEDYGDVKPGDPEWDEYYPEFVLIARNRIRDSVNKQVFDAAMNDPNWIKPYPPPTNYKRSIGQHRRKWRKMLQSIKQQERDMR